MRNHSLTESLVYEEVYVDEIHRSHAGYSVTARGYGLKHGKVELTLVDSGRPRPTGVDISTKLRITIEVVS